MGRYVRAEEDSMNSVHLPFNEALTHAKLLKARGDREKESEGLIVVDQKNS